MLSTDGFDFALRPIVAQINSANFECQMTNELLDENRLG